MGKLLGSAQVILGYKELAALFEPGEPLLENVHNFGSYMLEQNSPNRIETFFFS